MRFLSAQPDTDYYIWQLQVQMHNFRKFGIEDKCIILMGYNPEVGINPNAIEFKEQTKAVVLFLEDTRNLSERLYVPSIRAHIIKKLYSDEHIHLVQNKSVFYHDSDILFVKLPNLKDMIDQRKIFVSDTISYIGAKYIKQKGGDELLNEMCKIVGINPLVVERNENCSGGAQYLFTSNFNLSNDFWEKVERDSNDLYKVMMVTSTKYSPEHPIQAWTADMWGLLWNLWLVGIDTEITPEMSFSWATTPYMLLNDHNIFHNAGVTNTNKNMFFKGEFINKSPFGQNFDYVSKEYCSKFYVNEIEECGNEMKKEK